MDAQIRKAPIPIISMALALILAPGFLASQELELELSDSVSVRRVECTGLCWKWLTRVLVGPVATGKTADLQLRNWGRDTVSVTEALVFAKGDVSEFFWKSALDTLTLGRMQTKTAELPLSTLISRGPDRYAGEIRVRASNVEKSLSAPFRLYVRNGPGWVVFCLLLGFLGGRFVLKINETEEPHTIRPEKPKTAMKLFKKFLHFSGCLFSGFGWKTGTSTGRIRLGAILTGVAWPTNSKCHEYRVRVGVAWVLLALAVYQGLKILYVNDLTFGDNGILDYAAVFAWAAATDGGQRFLTNLKWNP